MVVALVLFIVLVTVNEPCLYLDSHAWALQRHVQESFRAVRASPHHTVRVCVVFCVCLFLLCCYIFCTELIELTVLVSYVRCCLLVCVISCIGGPPGICQVQHLSVTKVSPGGVGGPPPQGHLLSGELRGSQGRGFEHRSA